MADVDSLQIKISASSEQAASAIDKLTASLTKLKSAFNGGTKKYDNLAKSLRELGDTARGMKDSIGALAKAASAIERLANIKSVKIPKGIGDGIRNIGLAAEMVTPQSVENLDRMTRSLQRLQNVDFRGFSSGVRSINRVSTSGSQAAPAESGTEEAQSSTRGVRAILSGLRERVKLNIDTEALKRVADLARTALGHLKSLGKTIRVRIEAATIGKLKENLKGVVTIFKSLGRIAFYRAIRSAIKAITTAFSEGLKNAYAFSAGLSNAIDGRIATALDGLAGKATTMKNQLGAAFGSLLTAIAPIISALISLITALATAITQLFAAFSGGTFLRAKDSSAALADNMKAGGGAAKEWKNQLMGFDEINRLEDQSGGGGGGGGGGLDYNDMFEVVQIDQAIQDFVDKFKKAIKDGNWQGAGELLGNKVNELVENIDWAGIGRKLGYFFNGAIQTLYYTLSTIDFRKIGAKVAELLNNALEEINFEILGRLLFRKMTLAWDFFLGLILELDWHKLGDKLGDLFEGALKELGDWLDSYQWDQVAKKISDNLINFVNGLDGARLGLAITTLVNKALHDAKTFIENLKWNEIGTAIGTQISNFFTNLGSDGAGAADLASAMSIFISGALDLLTSTVASLDWEAVATGMSNALIGFITNLDVVSMASSLWDFLDAAVSSLITMIGTIKWGELADSILAKISEALGALAGKAFQSLMKLFNIPEDETDIGNIALAIVQKLWDGIKSAISAGLTFVQDYIITPIKDAFDAWKAGDTTLADIGKDIWEGVKNGISSAITGIGGWLKTNIVDPFITGFKSVFGIASPSTEMEPYGGFIWEGVLQGIKNALTSVGTWIRENIWEPFKAGIKLIFSPEAAQARMGQFGVNIISGLKNGIINGLSGIGSWIITNVWGPIQSALDLMMSLLQSWWSSIVSFVGKINKKYNAPGYDVWNDPDAWNSNFASGGFPDQGQLFVAREAGPELVGTIGGRTAVVNNHDIVAAVSEGVFEAVASAMGGSNGGGQPITIYLDGREIARSTTRYQNQMARAGAY